MTGHGCPECGAQRGVDGRPGCSCAGRAAETPHAERSAEAAAAEDFDPLRIRPYVVLPNASAELDDEATAPPETAAERTMRLGAVVPATDSAAGSAAAPVADSAADPAAGSAAAPVAGSTADQAPGGAGPAGAAPPRAPRRRGRLAALAVGAAATAAIATAAFAGTLFADDATPKQALPDASDTGLPYSGAAPASGKSPSATAVLSD
ncbi:hypothetical protein [Streptomyces sp. NPDC048111]|uniref:hypothetical protein n=1 Tax=Streptomyces sp. NPDC048111 TaxID=3365500 RepID=UPI0037229888